ncbi:MAG TPA: DUF2179 domain-containing protein [Firmicutes bacterium]|nr:DUF2179 domain-containing protein [Bacillota bacterium]
MLLEYLFIFCARVCDVSLATVRLLMVVRGKRLQAAMIGFVEVTIFILALQRVMSNLSDPFKLVAYALGFATGNYTGSLIEEKMALGIQTVLVILKQGCAEAVATVLRSAGYGVTSLEGKGKEGTREILMVTAQRKRLGRLVDTLREADPEAFITILDARSALGGYVPAARVQVK